jgi:hypothetical protein
MTAKRFRRTGGRAVPLAAAAAVAAGVLGTASAAQPRATAAARTDTVASSRATVRDAPARLVLANALKGDTVRIEGYCGAWVRVRVSAGHAMATRLGWTARADLTRAANSGGLKGVPRICGTAAADRDRWRSYVSAMNGPFHSYRYSTATGTWHWVRYATRVTVAATPDCVPSYNYRRGATSDAVDPGRRITGLDLSRAGYRYATRSGQVALVTAPRAGGSGYGVWGFVPSGCLRGVGGAPVYFDRVVQLDRLPSGGPALTSARLASHGCHAGVRSPSHPALGWWPDPRRKPGCPVG